MMQNYFNYFSEVEEHFIRRRGKHLLVSPLDWTLIEMWKEHGIPLHVVLRGIDRSFESAREGRKKEPRTLFYCNPAVMEAFDEYKEATIGGRSEESATEEISDFDFGQVERFLAELADAVRSLSDESLDGVVGRIDALSKEISSSTSPKMEQLDRDITQIGADLVERLCRELDAELLKGLESDVQGELKIYKKRLDPEMYKKLERRHLERKVREHFGLPEFSILQLGL